MSLFSKIMARAALPGQAAAPFAQPKGMGRLEAEAQAVSVPLPTPPEAAEPLRQSRPMEEHDAQPTVAAHAKSMPSLPPKPQNSRHEGAAPPPPDPLTGRRDGRQTPSHFEPRSEDTPPAMLSAPDETADAQVDWHDVGEGGEAQPLFRAELAEEASVQHDLETQGGEGEARPRREMETAAIPTLARNKPVQGQEGEEPPAQQVPPLFVPNASQPVWQEDLTSADLTAETGGDHPASTEWEHSGPTEVVSPEPPLSSPPERPRVVIDQVDVMITEAAPQTPQSGPDLTAALSRMLSGRYLRGR